MFIILGAYLHDQGFFHTFDGGADPAQQENWLPNEQVRGYLRNLKSRHVLLIADACFAGDILDIKRSAAPRIQNGYFRRAHERVSRQVLTSGALETVPDASSFALNLKNELRGNTKPLLDPHMLFVAVRAGVRGTLPLYGVLRDSGHQIGGSFLLFLDESEEASQKRREKFRVEREEKQNHRRAASRLTLLLPGLGELHNADYPDGAIFTGTSLYLLLEYKKQRQRFFTLQEDINRDYSALLAMDSPVTLATVMYNQKIRHRKLNNLRNRVNATLQLYGLYWIYHLYRIKDRAIFFHNNPGPRIIFAEDRIQINFTVPFETTGETK